MLPNFAGEADEFNETRIVKTYRCLLSVIGILEYVAADVLREGENTTPGHKAEATHLQNTKLVYFEFERLVAL